MPKKSDEQGELYVPVNFAEGFASALDQLNNRDLPGKAAYSDRENNARIIFHEINVAQKAKADPVDKENPIQISARTAWYFAECAANNVKPSLAGYASSLGIGRDTLKRWLGGQTKLPIACLEELQRAYNIIDSVMNDALMNGYIDKIAAFFIMKNGLGYKDDNNGGDLVQLDREKTPEEIAAAYKDLPS